MLSCQLLGASIESQELTGVEVGDAEVLEVVGVAGERRRRSGKDQRHRDRSKKQGRGRTGGHGCWLCCARARCCSAGSRQGRQTTLIAGRGAGYWGLGSEPSE